MKKTSRKNIIPDSTEYTDVDGKRWVQTTTDDLFSIKELNDVIESIERESDAGEIILARIDFQKVNREYYEAASELQKKLRRQNDLLKKIIEEARTKIDRKNRKLRELIEYIRKLHVLLAHLSTGEEDIAKLQIPPEVLIRAMSESPAQTYDTGPEYEEVEEIPLPFDAGWKLK